MWSNKCFVGCGFEVLVMNFDVAFDFFFFFFDSV